MCLFLPKVCAAFKMKTKALSVARNETNTAILLDLVAERERERERELWSLLKQNPTVDKGRRLSCKLSL